jgi:hypothetical protein
MWDLWERLNHTLEQFFRISIDGKPTPARLRLVAETLAELREIMLKDNLKHTWTFKAIHILEEWIWSTLRQENMFDIVERLRALKEEQAEERKAQKEGQT